MTARNCTKLLPKPAIHEDGSCTACAGGWMCEYHQQESLRRDERLSAALRLSNKAARANEIARICAHYELESDEYQTREQKAELLLGSY